MIKSAFLALAVVLFASAAFSQNNDSMFLIEMENFSIECQDVSIELNDDNSPVIVKDAILKSSSTAIENMTISKTSYTCEDIGENLVTITVIDIHGAEATCSGTVHVIDRTLPTAVCNDLTITLDDTGAYTIEAEEVVSEGADNCGEVIFSLSQSIFDTDHIGEKVIEVTISDPSDNISTCNAVVTVEGDTTPPEVVCQDITIPLDDSGNAIITVNDVVEYYNDNASIVTLTLDQSSFNCSHIGANTVLVTAIDLSGNITIETAIVTVVDLIAPIVLCTDIDLALDASGFASITAEDITSSSSDACGIESLSTDIASLNNDNIGNNNVVVTALDVNGNVSTCISTVNIFDFDLPVAVCQDITVQLNEAGKATIVAGDVDNGSIASGGLVSATIDITYFNCSLLGANAVTLIVSDASGNTSECIATVTVEDNENPSLTTQDITIQLSAEGTASISPIDLMSASYDNCSIDLTASQLNFDCSNIGINTVIVTAIDPSGNATVKTASVNVIDNIAPTAVCQNLYITLDANGEAVILAEDLDGGSSDACGIENLSTDVNTLTIANLGANNIALAATDGSGNVSSCTSIVTVINNSIPTAMCQDIIIELDNTGNASITPSDIDDGSFDNFGIVSSTLNQTNFNCSHVGVNSVLLAVTNTLGNMSVCNASVTVEDNIAPTVTCQDLSVTLDSNGEAIILAEDLDDGSSDNCGILYFSTDVSILTAANLGENNVFLSVIDINGNISTCESLITVYGFQGQSNPDDSENDLSINNGNSTSLTALENKVNPIIMNLYPNPVKNGLANVTLKDLPVGDKTIEVSILNNLGVVIRSKQIAEATPNANLRLENLDDLLPGTYTIHARVNGQNKTSQMVIVQ